MDSSKVKAVLFDLDGTLLDTLKDIGAGANIALRRYGCPERSMEEYRQLVGHGIRVLFSKAAPPGLDPQRFEEILAFYLQYYPEHCTDHTDEFPGIRDMLHALEARGYLLGVLSNKTESTAKKIMAHYFPEVSFRLVWGNNGTRPLKPSGEAGTMLCQELGLAPDEIVFVGDGDTDVEFAAAAGFRCAACTWGYRDPEQLRAAGATFLADNVQELRAFLGC